jgi:murein DD-endopeptidase MepM/ murein hydrolase activator NlpD
MMERLRLHFAAILLAAACAACARTTPPAPVVTGPGGRASAPTTSAASVAPKIVPRPDAVTVQTGETVYAIARRFDVPVRALIEVNGLNPPYQLQAGRKLVLPQLRQHIVQPGDTLYSISRRYDVDTTTLARSNGLPPPYRVVVGQPLVLPTTVETGGGRAPVIQATAPAASYAAPALQTAPAVVARSEPRPVPPPLPIEPTKPEPPAAVLAPPATSAPAPPEERIAALPPPAPRSSGRGFLWPVSGRIVAAYGTGDGGTHNDGINIAAPEGTPVIAADAGIVAYAGNELRGYGNLVLVKHADGWMTAYAHNAALLVKRGEKVRRGQTIARVGATGVVGEPQLHFEIRHGTRALDPGEYLPAPATTAASG